MRDQAECSRQHCVSSQGLTTFTRNAPVTFRAVFGSYSRLVLIGVGDAVIALVGQVAGTYMGGTLDGVGATLGPKPWWEDSVAIVVSVVSTLTFLVIYRGYRCLHRSFFELGRDVFTAALWSVLLVALVHVRRADRTPEVPAWLIAGVIIGCLLVLWRVPFARWARKVWRKRPVTLVSTQPEDWQWRLPSYVAVHRSMTPQAFLQAPPAAERVMITPDVGVQARERIVAWALRNQVPLYLVPDAYEILMTSSRRTQLNDILLLEIRPLALPVEFRGIKRMTDLLGAVALFWVFVPLFLVVPLLIWLEDRGPVLYRQKRVGRDGKLFDVIKFRTMVPDAEKESGPVWARQEDPRITRIGRLLRSTRIDELPQLVNVLRGEMSLVGPRPERPELAIEFAAQNPMFRAREAVKPGITGLAQVLSYYDTDPSSKLRFDLSYISRWRPGLDLLILWWTVPVMLLGSARMRVPGRGPTSMPEKWTITSQSTGGQQHESHLIEVGRERSGQA